MAVLWNIVGLKYEVQYGMVARMGNVGRMAFECSVHSIGKNAHRSMWPGCRLHVNNVTWSHCCRHVTTLVSCDQVDITWSYCCRPWTSYRHVIILLPSRGQIGVMWPWCRSHVTILPSRDRNVTWPARHHLARSIIVSSICAICPALIVYRYSQRTS